MNVRQLTIPGCYLIDGTRLKDDRGDFFKLFNASAFHSAGLESNFTESYVTKSKRGVIRGMHFQTPPSAHAKVIFCMSGSVLDAIVDLRVGSPTFSKSESVILSGDDSKMIYLPPGIAHGFASLEDNTAMWYLVSSEYDSHADKGVHWNSVGINWWDGLNVPKTPIVSDRDQSFPDMSDYESPFAYRFNL